jgi:hypothetical protein
MAAIIRRARRARQDGRVVQGRNAAEDLHAFPDRSVAKAFFSEEKKQKTFELLSRTRAATYARITGV